MGLHGTFATVFQSLAGNPIVDWLFMLGLLGIGVALIVGAGVRIAAISGSIMVLLMWLAEFPSANNPLLDEHVIYFFVFLVLSSTDVTQQMGLGAWWQKLPLVKKNPILK
jgi:thiosulfate dehydrogenase [quinone] large subunit